MKILTLKNGGFAEQSLTNEATPKWFVNGTCYAAFGNGDPALACWHYTMDTVVAPTPDQVGTSAARCVKFRLPKAITASYMRVFSIAAVSLYKFAIYDGVTNARLWQSNTITTVVNDWNSISLGSLSLEANRDYWLCIAVTGTGTTAAFRSFSSPVDPNFYGAANSPLGSLSIGLPVYAQFAVPSGAFPLILPALSPAAYAGLSTGTIPLAFISTF